MQMELPAEVEMVLDRLETAGFSAWLVGGCVRDAVVGRKAKDYDIATAALPGEVAVLFDGICPIAVTGARHGTVTVIVDGRPIEVTTYRMEEGYHDHRRPDSVQFICGIEGDLARRDFTINAMAYHPRRGLLDPFGGREDLAAGVIRCVGDARKRFSEDALRMLRALRFSARFGFRLEEQTHAALCEKKQDLRFVAVERIFSELTGLLIGNAVGSVLRQYPEVIFEIIPELRPTFSFQQHNPHHQYTVWEHTTRAVEAAPKEEGIRLALLLHDIGKPGVFSVDAKGVGHFYGHAAVSAEMAQKVLRRLRAPSALCARVEQMVRYHDLDLPVGETALKRRIQRFGEKGYLELLEVREADMRGKGTEVSEGLAEIQRVRTEVAQLIARPLCLDRFSLAVNGRDVMAAGVPAGPMVGRVLAFLLEMVVEGRCENSRAALLELVEKAVDAKIWEGTHRPSIPG